MQSFEQPKTAVEEGLRIKLGESGRDGSFNTPCVQLLDTLDDVVGSWPATMTGRPDQSDEAIPLPGHDTKTGCTGEAAAKPSCVGVWGCMIHAEARLRPTGVSTW